MNPENHNATEEQILEDDGIIDIEQYAKAGKDVPKAERYRIRIDTSSYVVETSTINGGEILTLAGKVPPENYLLNQKLHGGQVLTINLTDTVDLTAPGVERFMTLPKDQTEG